MPTPPSAAMDEWTIERICDALAPEQVKVFTTQIQQVPANDLLRVFAQWKRVVEGPRTAPDSPDAFTWQAEG